MRSAPPRVPEGSSSRAVISYAVFCLQKKPAGERASTGACCKASNARTITRISGDGGRGGGRASAGNLGEAETEPKRKGAGPRALYDAPEARVSPVPYMRSRARSGKRAQGPPGYRV